MTRLSSSVFIGGVLIRKLVGCKLSVASRDKSLQPGQGMTGVAVLCMSKKRIKLQPLLVEPLLSHAVLMA